MMYAILILQDAAERVIEANEDELLGVVILARAAYYLRYGSLNSPGASTRCLSERLEWMDEHVCLPSTAQVV